MSVVGAMLILQRKLGVRKDVGKQVVNGYVQFGGCATSAGVVRGAVG